MMVKIGKDFSCGCRVSGGHWFLCSKHEIKLIDLLHEPETNTVSDVVRDGKGNVIGFKNERPMKVK